MLVEGGVPSRGSGDEYFELPRERVWVLLGNFPGGSKLRKMIERFLLAWVLSVALAFTFYAMLGLERHQRIILLIIVGGALLLTPAIVPTANPLIRALLAVNAVLLLTKLHDVQIDTHQGQRPGLRTFVLFLISPTLCRKAPGIKICGSKTRCLTRLAWSMLGFSAATCLLGYLIVLDWRPYPWLLQHVAKVTTSILAVDRLCASVVATWQLCGGASGEMMQQPYLARTPADFWRRWNIPMQRFFHGRVFKPAKGRRAPARAIMFVFILSGIMHEYVFSIALGRLQGWQMAFFIIQGVAALATIRIKPRGWFAVLWTGATFSFNIATGVLFFVAIDRLVTFYSRPLPAWWLAWFG